MMHKISLLDCTLRDGGYVNDWKFTYKGMCGFCEKIKKTNVEYCELGFIKGTEYDKEKAIFPDIDSFKNIIGEKSSSMIYVGMYDMSSPVDLSRIKNRDEKSIDGIRVIFKNTKIDEGLLVCKELKNKGYIVFANLVNTEVYSDEQIKYALSKVNELKLDGATIVDTFGDLNNAEFLDLVEKYDKYLNKNIVLCYHAHNNLQQAYQNAECLVNLDLDRDILIDASVFGMGRGAGNLNLELFAKYLNEKFDKKYNIVPMLEIMDEYLQDFYINNFWGYSLPLYISASLKTHPNYAIYLANKGALTEKALYDILKSIDANDKINYSKDVAEACYRKYQENLIDDKKAKDNLKKLFENKNILILAPGNSLNTHKELIDNYINENNPIIIALNFYSEIFKPQYVFSSNMRRYNKIDGDTRFISILTSNMKEAKKVDYVVNYSSLLNADKAIYDNSGIMLLKLLSEIGIKKVNIAGMDGYSHTDKNVYVNEDVSYDFRNDANSRNIAIAKELSFLKSTIDFAFLTPSFYDK